jgi:hypothetical protein
MGKRKKNKRGQRVSNSSSESEIEGPSREQRSTPEDAKKRKTSMSDQRTIRANDRNSLEKVLEKYELPMQRFKSQVLSKVVPSALNATMALIGGNDLRLQVIENWVGKDNLCDEFENGNDQLMSSTKNDDRYFEQNTPLSSNRQVRTRPAWAAAKDWTFEQYIPPKESEFRTGSMECWLSRFKAYVKDNEVEEKVALLGLEQKSGEIMREEYQCIIRDNPSMVKSLQNITGKMVEVWISRAGARNMALLAFQAIRQGVEENCVNFVERLLKYSRYVFWEGRTLDQQWEEKLNVVIMGTRNENLEFFATEVKEVGEFVMMENKLKSRAVACDRRESKVKQFKEERFLDEKICKVDDENEICRVQDKPGTTQDMRFGQQRSGGYGRGGYRDQAYQNTYQPYRDQRGGFNRFRGNQRPNFNRGNSYSSWRSQPNVQQNSDERKEISCALCGEKGHACYRCPHIETASKLIKENVSK